MLDWKQMPQPPSPTGINVFPGTPEKVLLFSSDLPEIKARVTGIPGVYYAIFKDQVLTIHGQWNKVVQCTASPSTPFSQSDSVTTGATFSTTSTETVALHFGVANSLLSIGGALTDTTTHTTTLHQSVTKTQDFKVTPLKTEISAVWWQLVYTYTITGEKGITAGNGPYQPQGNFNAQFISSPKTFSSTQYPESAEIETKGFEDY
ncbi:hypothetical protein OAT18_01500 [Tenacibaculum sp.]|nr:hypothetical protein [Tenacibaculum sp.]